MSPFGICPRTLLLIETLSVFDAVADPSIGLGEASTAAPQAWERSVSLGLMVWPGNATMFGLWYCMFGLLNGPLVPLAANSQVPTVFCCTVLRPVVEL